MATKKTGKAKQTEKAVEAPPVGETSKEAANIADTSGDTPGVPPGAHLDAPARREVS